MADSKYISKVRIGNEDFAFRDKEALAAAQAAQSVAENISVPVDGVTSDITFKDANGKMYKLALDGKKVKLVAVTYNAPTITLSNFKWNGAATTSYNIDAPSTSSVTGEVSGTLTVTNGTKPTCNVSGVTISGSASPYTIGGSAAIGNNASVTFTFTTQGTMADPSTGQTAKPTKSQTISRTGVIATGVAYNAANVTPTSNNTGGFKFNINSTAISPSAVTIGTTTVTLTMSTTGYIYIFSNAEKSFALSLSKTDVDGTQIAGGLDYVGTAKTYSTGNKTYYIYRSSNTFTSGANVYVKTIGNN